MKEENLYTASIINSTINAIDNALGVLENNDNPISLIKVGKLMNNGTIIDIPLISIQKKQVGEFGYNESLNGVMDRIISGMTKDLINYKNMLLEEVKTL